MTITLTENGMLWVAWAGFPPNSGVVSLFSFSYRSLAMGKSLKSKVPSFFFFLGLPCSPAKSDLRPVPQKPLQSSPCPLLTIQQPAKTPYSVSFLLTFSEENLAGYDQEKLGTSPFRSPVNVQPVEVIILQ